MRYTEQEMEALNKTLKELNNLGISMSKSELSILIDDGICAKERAFSDYLVAEHIYQFLCAGSNEERIREVIREAEEMEDKEFSKWLEKAKQIIIN